MLSKLIRKYTKLIQRLDPRQDDEISIERFDHFDQIYQPGEHMLWQGKPSARHAWADHDQMEPSGSVGDRPVTLRVRKVELVLALVFIAFMFFMGIVSFYAGVSEIMQKQDVATIGPSIFLILVGITFMSGLPFLLRPVGNRMRARRLTYVLTTKRAMIVRRGHAWAEIWGRSPVIISVSLLFLYGVFFFGWLFIEGAYRDFIDGAGFSTWAARGFLLVFMSYFGFIFVAVGYIGLRFQLAIIFDAIKDPGGFFVRSFDFEDIERSDFPVVSRLRKDGTGDVILGQDGHWEYDIDFNRAWFKINAVGFLSVPEAQQVSVEVERALA